LKEIKRRKDSPHEIRDPVATIEAAGRETSMALRAMDSQSPWSKQKISARPWSPRCALKPEFGITFFVGMRPVDRTRPENAKAGDPEFTNR